jgi:hypothetical protein
MSEMEVKIVRLTSGEEILGKVFDGEDSITIKKPSIIIPAGREQLALAQWLPYSTIDDGVEIKKEYVVFMVSPMTELLNQYNESFGSGLFVPPTPQASCGLGIQGSGEPPLKLTT